MDLNYMNDIKNNENELDNQEQSVIIYEDNHIIVACKPQNIPTQEDLSGDRDFLSIIKDYVRYKYNKPGNVFIGLVHRLDRPTGGVMVFAKTSKAAARLSEQMQQGEFTKKYLTVVIGNPKYRADRLVHYLKKDEKNNIVMIAPSGENGSKQAVLDYAVRQVERNTNPILSLVEVHLHTGRSHQIRVQLSTIGHPLYGDHKYGINKDGKVVGENLALWAYQLCFYHPITKESMKFVVYPPQQKPWQYFALDKVCDVIKPD